MPSPRPIRRPHRSKPADAPKPEVKPKPTAAEVKSIRAAEATPVEEIDPRCLDINDDMYDPLMAIRARRAGILPKTDAVQIAQQNALNCHSLSDELRHDAR